MSLSKWDDFPLHQTSEFIAHPATSDRNFYDRYYFNCLDVENDFFAIFGLGQYPNLGTTDAFCSVAFEGAQHIVRMSQPLVERSDVAVGPFAIDVQVPLQRLRVTIAEGDYPVSMDLTFEGFTRAIEEPRQYLRSKGKVVFDTQRLAQTGNWTGTITVGAKTMTVNGVGTRDRSWGVRPVGEPEPGGIREGENVMAGMWNYFPMQFEDHSIYYICHEDAHGVRHLVQSERVWKDPNREVEDLGPAEWHHVLEPNSRVVTSSTISFPEAGIAVECEPAVTNWISIGTGYGIDQDWRHGMYQGPELVVQGLTLQIDEIRGIAQYGIVDHGARFTYDGHVGFGLLEHGFFGPFPKVGLNDAYGLTPEA